MVDSNLSISSRKILYISYNFNNSFFSIGTESGFIVFSTNPVQMRFERNLRGGISIVEMLNQSNIFCLVGGGKSPKYAPNKLLIWDDKQTKEVYEFRFDFIVKNCKIKKQKIFSICDEIISIIDLEKMEITEQIKTFENKIGSCALAHDPNNYLFAYPAMAQGAVAVRDFSQSDNIESNIIKAHNSSLSALEMNFDGSLLATTSEKGTLIRVHETKKRKMLYEFRRGTETATIYSIAFDTGNRFLGVTSDRGTVHLFVIEKNEEGEKLKRVKNTKSVFAGVSKMIGFGFGKIFQSEWSFTQIKVPIKEKSIIAINGDDKTIEVLCYDGKYILAEFGQNLGSDDTKYKLLKEKMIFS